MATWNGVITNAGNRLLNEWVNEKTLNFDSAASGQGTVAEVAMMAQTALVNEKQVASLLGGEKVASGIRLKLRIAAPDTAYTLNQFRVSASVDGGSPAMLALFQLEQGIPIPSKTESPDFVYTFYALISCSNTGTWTVTVDTSACVTQGDMTAAITEAVRTKQDKLTGTPGQVVGFDEEGNAVPQAVGGVTTFNGRSGAVVPAKGDYTAKMVGAVAEPNGGKAGQVLTKTEDGTEWGDAPNAENAVTVPGGGTMQMGESLGAGPYTIEVTEDEDSDLSAAQVGYNNEGTGITATNVQDAVTELFTSVSEGKAAIAAAITDKGVETAADATFQQMAGNIEQISAGGGWAVIKAFGNSRQTRAGGGISEYGNVSIPVKKEPTALCILTQPYSDERSIYGTILAKDNGTWEVVSKVAIGAPDGSFIVDNITFSQNTISFRVGRDSDLFTFGNYIYVYTIYDEIPLT